MTRALNLVTLRGTPRWIAVCVGAYLVVDLFALHLCSANAQVFSIQGNSDSSAALSVIAMAAVNLYLSVRVLRRFRPGEPLRLAWMLMAFAAAAQVVSGILAQVLGADWLLNPQLSSAHAQGGIVAQVRFGMHIAGTELRLGVLAAALIPVLRVLRRFGFWARPSATDWAVFGIACLFALCRLVEHGGQANLLPGLAILCILVLEAMLLRQSIVRMGTGPIAMCWAAFVCGVFLTGLAELAVWVIPHFSDAWPPVTIVSLTQFPIAAVFALAPAYQLMAQRRASHPTPSPREDAVTGIPAMAR
ncbi:MAG: hypothetical protein WDO73_26840 [Ignavibacteriota bacterium]